MLLEPDRTIDEAAETGMLLAYFAARTPDKAAIHSPRGDRSFDMLNANANRLVRALRGAGLKAGDGIALLCGNTPEFIEVYSAALRSGLRLTPINWHLTAEEVAYIVADCEAKALIAHSELASLCTHIPGSLSLKLAVAGPIPGFASYEAALAAESGSDINDPSLGTHMLYTSGTTGRPKGVFRKKGIAVRPQRAGTPMNYGEGAVSLLCGPAYHGGPLNTDITYPLATGVPVVMMEKFDPARFLELVETYRVTHTHMVSTMFQRLLRLPEAARQAHDLSSLKLLAHGAAPTPPEVKRAMIDWLGPVLFEYYAATEGNGAFGITSEEWLRKPGSVGRLDPKYGAKVLNSDGQPCAPGEVGQIFFANRLAPFEYYKAPEKTASAFRGDDFTVGDMGYLDEDGYLFLTGRTAECIISGGVNIYPQEIDNVLLRHPAVREVCTIGAPNEEWGEEVRSVIALSDGYEASDALAEELRGFVRESLAGYKTPRGIDFNDDIPRSEAGKVLRQQVRAPYWAGRTKTI